MSSVELQPVLSIVTILQGMFFIISVFLILTAFSSSASTSAISAWPPAEEMPWAAS